MKLGAIVLILMFKVKLIENLILLKKEKSSKLFCWIPLEVFWDNSQ